MGLIEPLLDVFLKAVQLLVHVDDAFREQARVSAQIFDLDPGVPDLFMDPFETSIHVLPCLPKSLVDGTESLVNAAKSFVEIGNQFLIHIISA